MGLVVVAAVCLFFILFCFAFAFLPHVSKSRCKRSQYAGKDNRVQEKTPLSQGLGKRQPSKKAFD